MAGSASHSDLVMLVARLGETFALSLLSFFLYIFTENNL